MRRLKVESSNISEIGYSIEDEILEIKFKRTEKIYQYYNVRSEIVCKLIFNESIGSHFSKNIAKVYQFKKMEE